MSNIYDVGDLVRCSGQFLDQNNAVVDPTNVFFSFKTPAGVTTTYQYGIDSQLVKDSIGNYHVDVNANTTGIRYYRFYSTGTGQSSAEGLFTIPVTNF